MNLTLKHAEFSSDGIFGSLMDSDGNQIATTLEHAYPTGNGDGSYAPKLIPGIYKCVRGMHQLAHMRAPFETFEITGVVGHTNILFHVGNFNDDSEGCVLLGAATTLGPKGTQMLINSRSTFAKFMRLQDNVTEFLLTVL